MKRLLPLFIGVAFAGSFFLAGHIANTDGGKTIIMSAGHNGDLNFLDLDLRDDNTFKLKNVGPFGGTIHRGKYTFWNDTLMLDDDIDGLYPGGKFVVRMNDENRKYFDPLGRDSTKYAYRLYISKSSRGVAE
ncbi:MAG: hypothetical protein K0Q66_2430 [Chitinophagaceae bacterium]|nr:hypothetical protein [Chitinophagaceae bacterium]